MRFRVGLENNNDGRTIAWALEHLGCFAYGTDDRAALAAFPQEARSYAAWVGAHGGNWLPADEKVEAIREETFDVYYVDPSFERIPGGHGGMVESFFLYDWKPLTGTEVQRALQLLAWTRADLLGVVGGLSAEQLARQPSGERWDINGILNHIGGAEWWYQERLGHPWPAAEDDLPSQPFERLGLVRDHFNSLLPEFEGVKQVVGLDGEFWSPRKVLRRALWHERDHTQHIRKLL
jgi:hypothetical protein